MSIQCGMIFLEYVGCKGSQCVCFTCQQALNIPYLCVYMCLCTWYMSRSLSLGAPTTTHASSSPDGTSAITYKHTHCKKHIMYIQVRWLHYSLFNERWGFCISSSLFVTAGKSDIMNDNNGSDDSNSTWFIKRFQLLTSSEFHVDMTKLEFGLTNLPNIIS